MSSDILGRTGADLVDIIRIGEPDFSTPQLLVDYFRLEPADAEIISRKADEARVITSAEGSLALEDVVPRIDPTQPRTTRSVYFSPAGGIVVNGCMADSFARDIAQGSILDISPEEAAKAGIRAAGIFELGRFVSRRIYTDLIFSQQFHRIQLPVPSRELEVDEFFEAFDAELTSRGLEGDYSQAASFDEARAFYFRHLRPEQFYSRGGVHTLKAVSPQLDALGLFTGFRRRYLNNHINAGNALLVEEDTQLPAEELYPPIREVAALLPMRHTDFMQLCSYVSRIRDPKVTSIVEEA